MRLQLFEVFLALILAICQAKGDLSKFLTKKIVQGEEGQQSEKECNIEGITPRRIRKAFDLDNPEKLIEFANCLPTAVLHLSHSQLDLSLQSPEIVKGLEEATIVAMLTNKNLTDTIKKQISDATLAELIKIRPDFTSYITPETLIYTHVRELLKNEQFLKHFTPQFLAGLIENHENTRQLLTEDSVRVGLDLYPDLYQHLGNDSLGDKNFLRKLPCDVFQSAVMDTDYIQSLNQNVLIEITLLNQISQKNGSKTDFFTCIGPESGRKLFQNFNLVAKLPGQHIGFLVERESIRQMLDVKSVQVGLLVYPGIYKYLGNETLASYHLWRLLVKAGKDCDQLSKAAKDKEFLHSLNQEALEAITGFPFFYDCLKEFKELEELFKDQTLVDRMSTHHIGELLENSGDVSKQFRDLLDEEAVKIGVANKPDLYQFIGNNALSDPRFAGLVPCDQYNRAVKNKTFLHTLNTQALVTVTSLPLPKFFNCLDDSEKVALFKDEYLSRNLPADHIGNMLERSKEIRKVLDKQSIEIGLKAHPELFKSLRSETLADQDFLALLDCSIFKKASNDVKFLRSLNATELIVITSLTSISSNDGNHKEIFGCLDETEGKRLFGDRSLIRKLTTQHIAGLIEKSEKVRGLMDLDLVNLGLEEHPDIYKFLGQNSLCDEKFLSVLPCKTFVRVAHDTDFLLEQNEKVLETIAFFSNISLENGTKTDFFECLGKKNVRKLMGNRTVLRHLPLSHVVRIVNEKCCNFFDEQTTDSALIAHPSLPVYMNDRALRYGLWFFEKQRFLRRLPCGIYLSTIRNSTFVDRIFDRPLKAMAKNHHFWRCLPIEYIRDMMKTTKIGRKLSIFTAIEAIDAIRTVHNLDFEVLMNIFEYQFPQMRERYREIVIRAKIEASPINKYLRHQDRKVGVWYTLNHDGSIG